MSERKPVIGITLGDAAGIGPEIVLKSLGDPDLVESSRTVLIGDRDHIIHLSEQNKLALTFAEFEAARDPGSSIEVAHAGALPKTFDLGRDQAETGRASAECIVEGVRLWREGLIDAISTAPISKRAIQMGGFNYPGHTEFLAELTGTQKFAMSFFADGLRVILHSTHLPLREAIGRVKKEALKERIAFADAEFSRLLKKKVKLAVAGLNPHASEGGMFGSEEADEIAPAVQECRQTGIDVKGPFSPDTIFLRGYRGEFDAVVALYHDQATIAVKSISFGSGVNVTLGLPLIRTSVDHGTAYDIAGTWRADESSMKSAILLAGDLVRISRPES